MFGKTFSFWRRLTGKPGSEKGREAEKRVWVRYPANLDATYQLAGNVERFSARVRDISRGGINLLVRRPLQAGELLSIELPAGADEPVQTVLACIVRVDDHEPGTWTLGCVFARELEDGDMETFGARRQKNIPSDQRAWMRFPCNIHASYMLVGDIDAEPFSAQVLNISPSGIGLIVDREIETGTLLSLELQSPDRSSSLSIVSCVVHAGKRGANEWALGCNFIRELSDQDLQCLVAE
jgi:c-di-GMP-binding flagellar brake protein YcgR